MLPPYEPKVIEGCLICNLRDHLFCAFSLRRGRRLTASWSLPSYPGAQYCSSEAETWAASPASVAAGHKQPARNEGHCTAALAPD